MNRVRKYDPFQSALKSGHPVKVIAFKRDHILHDYTHDGGGEYANDTYDHSENLHVYSGD